MLVFTEQNLVFLAVPKTGTTALHLALKPHADIIFTKQRKHMNAMHYRMRVAPFLETAYGITPKPFAVMRNPIDQIGSWYRYRRRLDRPVTKRSTLGISFDEFVLASMEDTPPPYAGIGSQFGFLSTRRGKIAVAHLFAYESQTVLRAFLSEHFHSDLEIKQKNVSPDMPLDLSPEVEAKLRVARAQEFDLYHRLMDQGGYLHNPRV